MLRPYTGRDGTASYPTGVCFLIRFHEPSMHGDLIRIVQEIREPLFFLELTFCDARLPTPASLLR
jgi:hypothetical protein